MAEHSGGGGGDDNVDWNTDDELEIDNFQFSPPSSPVHSMAEPACRNSQNVVRTFIEMGFSHQMIEKAIEETAGPSSEPRLILEALVKYSTCDEASSSKKVIDNLIDMGFSEELVVKAIQEYGEENTDAITNALLSYTEAERLRKTEDEDINVNPSLDNIDDENLYSGLLSSDEETLNSSNEHGRLQALLKMDYSRDEASIAIERCGENVSVAELVDFISAAQMARQFDDFFTIPDDEALRITGKKRRAYNESSRREKNVNSPVASGDNLIRLPNPMIGFGVPNQPGLRMHREVPIPDVARGPPYFYYENVAMAPKGVWDKISSHLYEIRPEFVDSMYFSAAMRKRGYIHNLPITNRFQIQPPPHYTIQEAFPLSRRWWPTWDKRTKLNCLVTCIGSAQTTNKIRVQLENHDGDPPQEVKEYVIEKCKRWNFIWVGKNKVAPLDHDEMEKLLGFPRDHTRGGGISSTDRYKSLGNSFQVDTVAYHLSVLKPLYPNGINVLSLFTGIGGGEVALYRLQIRMRVVVSVEISEVNRNILRSFWEQTNQRGVLREFADVQELDNRTIEQLMDKYGAFDLVIGGSPCNNLAGGNRISRNGLEGEQSSLFYDYCRILHTVRHKAARMRR